MLTQNRLRHMVLKNDFSTTTSKYKEALKYYGYGDAITKQVLANSLIYPFPVLKNSRTLSKQASLARMPVPQLTSSIGRYLDAVKPFLNESEFEKTRKIAAEFVKEKGIGERLQSLLVQKSKTTDNWLAQWWLDKIYLEPRYNLIINVSPGTIYPKAAYTTMDGQLEFATKYLVGFLDFKKYLENQSLPVEKLGESPLCMDQYYKLFGTCRVPNENKDDIHVMQAYNLSLERTNHVIVIYKKRLFTLQIIDPVTGAGVSDSEILNSLKSIVNETTENGPGLGILTAENRDIWAKAYKQLSKYPKNRQNFEKIIDSLLVVCIDDEPLIPKKPSDDEKSLAAAEILHGDKKFTANRWFDKTIQVVFGSNGVWGVSFEHSIAEGVPHAVMNDYIYNHMKSSPGLALEDGSSKTRHRELVFEIPEDVNTVINTSTQSISKFIDNLDLYVLEFAAFGKNFPKSQKISPDAFVQISMQLAFFRSHNKLGNAYESGSLRKFHLGRTDIIRTCSADAAEFVRAMADDAASAHEQAQLLLKAINSHRAYTNRVLNCESFDRHLLGLKLIALENNIDLPAIYTDPAYQKACHYYISSSQISHKFESVSVFGPLVEDGYGACYNIMEKKIMFGLSSHNSCAATNTRAFADQIRQALLDCQSLLLKASSKL